MNFGKASNVDTKVGCFRIIFLLLSTIILFIIAIISNSSFIWLLLLIAFGLLLYFIIKYIFSDTTLYSLKKDTIGAEAPYGKYEGQCPNCHAIISFGFASPPSGNYECSECRSKFYFDKEQLRY